MTTVKIAENCKIVKEYQGIKKVISENKWRNSEVVKYKFYQVSHEESEKETTR